MLRELPSKDDYIQWQENAITKLVLLRVQERIAGIKDLLSTGAGLDALEDRRLTGMIAAYNTLLHLDYEEVTDE